MVKGEFIKGLATLSLIVINLILFASCNIVGNVLASSQEKKIEIASWKNNNYKVRIQQRQGWFGPDYYHCRVKSKKLGGIYYKTIVNESFSREAYSKCLINFPLRKDTLKVDVCKKQITQPNNK